ncbi:hypothetical protein F5882DRAFT_180295 [Hyaloscypha sp. PMI_1271]|nr:hypothetical protein F5882DRAFT_180295 [Hyaloscypha sp. PMI_1271]
MRWSIGCSFVLQARISAGHHIKAAKCGEIGPASTNHSMLPPLTPLQTSELQLFFFDGLLTVLYIEIPNLDGWGSEDLR